MNSFPEYVVLCDGDDNEMGTMLKSEVHGSHTLLHKAFSCFLFNKKGELLLQQRSSKKKTWPLIWSNSCCGHPLPGEERIDAVKRRLLDELGIKKAYVEYVSPYRYCFERDGVVENEICPIFVAFSDEEPQLNYSEVESIQWMKWVEFLEVLKSDSQGIWSEWCKEEAEILKTHPVFINFLNFSN